MLWTEQNMFIILITVTYNTGYTLSYFFFFRKVTTCLVSLAKDLNLSCWQDLNLSCWQDFKSRSLFCLDSHSLFKDSQHNWSGNGLKLKHQTWRKKFNGDLIIKFKQIYYRRNGLAYGSVPFCAFLVRCFI